MSLANAGKAYIRRTIQRSYEAMDVVFSHDLDDSELCNGCNSKRRGGRLQWAQEVVMIVNSRYLLLRL